MDRKYLEDELVRLVGVNPKYVYIVEEQVDDQVYLIRLDERYIGAIVPSKDCMHAGWIKNDKIVYDIGENPLHRNFNKV